MADSESSSSSSASSSADPDSDVTINEQQMNSLEDYVEASLMLQFCHGFFCM